MWIELPADSKNEYKRLILAFASLTDMFAQKVSDSDQKVAPIINSKFQETAFQRAFSAVAEDIGNTSFDVSVESEGKKYLVGIKTFGISSGDQKVAQFKAKHDEWSDIIDRIKNNSDLATSKEEIDELNQDLYLELANRIAIIRNERIESSYANIRGFRIDVSDSDLYSVYHVLMPSDKNDHMPKIFVGETSYDKIDVDNIQVLGCTGKNNPTNFYFRDGNHIYKYTAADSQLHMNFFNKDIVCDEWDVKYAEDAYAVFEKIADMVYPELNEKKGDSDEKENVEYHVGFLPENRLEESVCWTIWNKDGETELYSGFNSFYGTGSKMGKDQRAQRINKIYENYAEKVDVGKIDEVKNGLTSFLLEPAPTANDKAMKARLRKYLVDVVGEMNNSELKNDITKVLYRPMDEMYIPIPDSAHFHKSHPNFFGPGYGELIDGTSRLKLPKEQRVFNLIFDPSGDTMPAYITQDYGKAIESAEKQTFLGEWILRGVFQLEEYEPLTSRRLREININGLRFSKYKNSEDVHLEFIWIDESNPPKGYIQRI